VKTKGGHCGLFNNQRKLFYFFKAKIRLRLTVCKGRGQTAAPFLNRGKIIKLKK
jgi:hypothetical protein